MSESKACSRCKQIKPLSEFGIHRKTKDGHYSQCLICHRESRAAYRVRQAENIAKQQAKNYARNRSKRIAYANKRVYENRERHAAYASISKKRRHLQVAADTRRRNARKKANGVFLISNRELKRLNRGPCFYCGSSKEITIDHVVAIARGGTDSIGNLVPACKSCNSQKRQLTIMEWRVRKSR